MSGAGRWLAHGERGMSDTWQDIINHFRVLEAHHQESVATRPTTPKENKVDHPAHYGGNDDPYEAIKVIEAWDLNWNMGNVVKYVRRADFKGDAISDLEKAAWYLSREIERRKKADHA
jgi:hypothetical protein